MVMLDNYFDDDKAKNDSQLKAGNYATRGDDVIKGKYFIIVDSEIVKVI
ncbi:MAG: hypothetical protein WBK20_09905 [Spirochaetota bacterium]